MRTLADIPEILDTYAIEPPERRGEIIFVVAPCCGRKTAADAVLDVRGVPGTIVSGGGIFESRDQDFLCDGCRHRLYADESNAWTPSRLYDAVGTTPEHVRDLYARELLEQVAYWESRIVLDDRTMPGHRPDEAREAILAALPPGINPLRP